MFGKIRGSLGYEGHWGYDEGVRKDFEAKRFKTWIIIKTEGLNCSESKKGKQTNQENNSHFSSGRLTAAQNLLKPLILN